MHLASTFCTAAGGGSGLFRSGEAAFRNGDCEEEGEAAPATAAALRPAAAAMDVAEEKRDGWGEDEKTPWGVAGAARRSVTKGRVERRDHAYMGRRGQEGRELRRALLEQAGR